MKEEDKSTLHEIDKLNHTLFRLILSKDIPYSRKISWDQFSQMADFYHFARLIFVNELIHSCSLCTVQLSLFRGLIFVVCRSSAKATKIGSLKNFPLYDINHYAYFNLINVWQIITEGL